ncbi:hypothetical protein B296_00007351 [Ensete ventricosum]|uniref:Uncharacterized protein n=1 Tax=Ensete ventricosum TaxID=4639 RepID=A0A427AHI5_ENSVE|nr:hypothetical protein B296_00007351 [Ensete ventricosum]
MRKKASLPTVCSGGAGDKVAAEDGLSWPEIWRHCEEYVSLHVSASTDAELERMVAWVIEPQGTITDRGEESIPMVESWIGVDDSVAEASIVS